MGSIAALHLMRVLEHSERILAIELICAAQGLDLRRDLLPGLRPGRGVEEAQSRVRAVIPRLEHDREPGPDIAASERLVSEGRLADLAVPPGGPETSWLGLDRP
jgi:histidine ammonia-lyase